MPRPQLALSVGVLSPKAGCVAVSTITVTVPTPIVNTLQEVVNKPQRCILVSILLSCARGATALRALPTTPIAHLPQIVAAHVTLAPRFSHRLASHVSRRSISTTLSAFLE